MWCHEMATVWGETSLADRTGRDLVSWDAVTWLGEVVLWFFVTIYFLCKFTSGNTSPTKFCICKVYHLIDPLITMHILYLHVFYLKPLHTSIHIASVLMTTLTVCLEESWKHDQHLQEQDSSHQKCTNAFFSVWYLAWYEWEIWVFGWYMTELI